MMQRAQFLSSALVAAVLAIAPVAQAASPTSEGAGFLGSVTDAAQSLKLSKVPSAIEVSANRMELDYNAGRLAYDGAVVIKHAGMVLRSNKLAIEFDPKQKRSLRRINANGNVRIARGDDRASGNSAIYDPTTATVTLSGNAKLGSGPNTVEGDRVVVYLDSRRAIVESDSPASDAPNGDDPPPSSGRVRVVIMPDSLGDLREQGIEELKAPVQEKPAPEPVVPAATREASSPVAAPWQKKPLREKP